MTMEHKAFAFDCGAFDQELRPTLESALAWGEPSCLVDFIRTNFAELTHPCERRPLDDDWERNLSPRDAHQYGDLALTKFYDPSADVGLQSDWQEVSDWLVERGRGQLAFSPVLGRVVGPETEPFDPGKMGSYVQTATEVAVGLKVVRSLASGNGAPESLKRVIGMLEACAGRGLYVTF
jgi:hypothetical protein